MKGAHLTTEQIEAGLPEVLASPQDRGSLEAIVIRPRVDERELRQAARLSPEAGLEGDRWLGSSDGLLLPDGRPDPRAQVSLMNARILRLIAGRSETERWGGPARDHRCPPYGLRQVHGAFWPGCGAVCQCARAQLASLAGAVCPRARGWHDPGWRCRRQGGALDWN
jgi:hypothetical protein